MMVRDDEVISTNRETREARRDDENAMRKTRILSAR